mmetsp:Transcript_21659/g.53497  ORF Transcript_21659/g.53497 Transcript_21659/m.53497 type:complete len:88 (-) Transcript_21659:542-805(-)
MIISTLLECCSIMELIWKAGMNVDGLLCFLRCAHPVMLAYQQAMGIDSLAARLSPHDPFDMRRKVVLFSQGSWNLQWHGDPEASEQL